MTSRCKRRVANPTQAMRLSFPSLSAPHTGFSHYKYSFGRYRELTALLYESSVSRRTT